MTRYEAIKETIDNLNTADLVQLHNEFCSQDNRMDDWIYSMTEFDEVMSGMTPWEIARAAYYSGKFCPGHDYFWFDGYANLVSDDYPGDIVDAEDIAEYIDQEDDSLGCDEIQDVLDDYEEDEDEDEEDD